MSTTSPTGPALAPTRTLLVEALLLLERHPTDRLIWRVIVNRVLDLVPTCWTLDLTVLINEARDQHPDFATYFDARVGSIAVAA